MKRIIAVLCPQVSNNHVVTRTAANEIVRDFADVLWDNVEIDECVDGNVFRFPVECVDANAARSLQAALVAVLVRHGLGPK